MKSGFTLVELSIVLVIIGLLIGGILVGQSLIDSAKINQAVRQIQQYDIAVANFQQNYRQLPGDSNLFTLAGNNDGDPNDTISGAGVPECGQATCQEWMSFWKHLTDSNSLEDSYSNDYSSAYQAGVNVPEMLDLILYVYHNAIETVTFPKGWVYYIEPDDEAISLSLDAKLDDGIQTTGSIKTSSDGNPCVIDDPIRSCETQISIMSTTGNPLNN